MGGYCTKYYEIGDTITYGNQTVTDGVLNSGDAFDCDVNGDNIVDVDERFYYVSPFDNGVTRNENIAVLTYYKNYSNEVNQWSYTGVTYVHSGDDIGPRAAESRLPNFQVWPNIDYILNGDLPYANGTIYAENYTNYGMVSRLITLQEAINGCETNESTYPRFAQKCEYLVENTYYTNLNSTSGTMWTRTPIGVRKSYVITSAGSFTDADSWLDDYHSRPVIEVKLSDIDY